MPLSIGVSIRVNVLSTFLAAVFTACACLAQNQPVRALIVPPSTDIQTLGPGDQVQIRALHAEELGDRPVRIDSEGFIMLPGLGRIHAGGQTTEHLAADIESLLAKTIRDPKVAVDIVELKSQPVSVLGSVRAPGVYQMVGQKRVLELISMAGGFDQESGDMIKITRYTGADSGPNGEPNRVLDIRISDLMEGRRPEMNVVVHSGDIITVPRAKVIYVIGQVRKPGGFVVREQAFSVLKAVSMAEGLMPTAATSNARILREVEPHAQRKEIAVDVKGIMAGKVPDQALQPEDVLLIPTSAAKTVGMRLFEAGMQMGQGLVIWRTY